MSGMRFGWYGDDFTGATDTLAVLAQGGLRAMLFLGVPQPEHLERARQVLGGPLDAVGIAGAARAMAPAAMEAELAPVAQFFARAGVPLLHYKVCSTFDSAPQVGNIAVAVHTLRAGRANPLVAIVAGQPSLGRYCAFSNLFAAAGRDGAVERIDRHPTMRAHPVTPMAEADLRRHLAQQGLEPIAALHYPLYARGGDALDAALEHAMQGQPQAVLMDLADASHLAPVGRLLWQAAQRQPLLAVGSSAVAQALLAHWALPVAGGQRPLERAQGPVLLWAGSLSPVTARQVRAARSYETVRIVPGDLFDADAAAHASARIAGALRAGRHVLACTAPAEDQVRVATGGAELAEAGARFLRGVLEAEARAGRPLRRVGIAGGDTSSLAVQALGLWGLSCRATLGAGVAVSRTHSDDPAFDGVELMLKGGQMGAEDVFEQLL